MVRTIDYIHRVADEVDELYRWMYPIAYERAQQGGQSRGGGVPRPVESIGSAKSYVRAQVKLASRLVRRAAAEVLGAKAALERAAKDQDEDTAEHTPDEFHDSGPRIVTKAEVDAARKAKERRGRRGEGYGAA